MLTETKARTEFVQKLEGAICNTIKKAGVTKEDCTFFKEAKKLKTLDPYPALVIATNWREITKTFMFTSLIGIGNFAHQVNCSHSPHHSSLQALQTSLAVISDDINNTFSEFHKKAPKGLHGIHYIWWEEAILKPLQKICSVEDSEVSRQKILLPATLKLIEEMNQLANTILGFAVQLRIVEAIALDICLAFSPLFNAVMVNNSKLFSKREDLNWIYTHITAEVVHHKQVKDHESGMVIIAQTNIDREFMILLSERYIKLWADIFDQFAYIIKTH